MIRILPCWLMLAAAAHGAAPFVPANVVPPDLPREFRGAWVASVANLDWPSKPGLTTAEQQGELLAILDKARQLNLNAVILQVRPACDALYASKTEPWSEYLTGTMGKPPRPFWDPLEYAVVEAHKRGLELHAWFNPFRARHLSAFSPISREHISKTRPAIVKTYGKHLWLDPGLPEVHDYSMRVILDVVQRYDIDGVHVDDYFYPYREKTGFGPNSQMIPFPDWMSWNSYVKGGGRLGKDDWRRDNVNRFLARMYREVKQAKPWLKVGISPFGIYRPGFPPSVRGFDQFESIYADPRTWLQSGWLDYLAPQLYWRIDSPEQSFPVLLRWWAENNPKHRMIVAGLNTAAIGNGTNRWTAAEILRQVDLTRQQRGVDGAIHWNMSALMKNKGAIADELARGTYAQPALVPALPNPAAAAMSPRLRAAGPGGGTRIQWSVDNDKDVRFWLVQTRSGAQWRGVLWPRNTTAMDLSGTPDVVAIRTVDRFGVLGRPASFQRSAEKQ